MAYDFPINRISGPDWLFDDMVTTVGDFRLMVQNPGTSIFDAVQSQLGLKLTPKKAPAETLVIDHLEKIPTEN